MIPFALRIGVYEQLSLPSNSRADAIELLNPSLKTFSKYSHISRSSTSVGFSSDILLLQSKIESLKLNGSTTKLNDSFQVINVKTIKGANCPLPIDFQ